MSANTSFTQKVIETSITLAEGSFSSSGGEEFNTKTYALGVDCEITKPGLPEKNSARIVLYNVPLEDMEVLTSLEFEPQKVRKHRVVVMAGDMQRGLSLAFAGDMTTAIPDFTGAPDPSLIIEAIEGYVGSVTPVSPLTRPGAVNASGVFEQLAGQMGYTFVNRGVDVQLRNIALKGGPMQQAAALAKAARCELIVDDGELVIMPPGGMREDDAEGNTVVWSAESGLLGYPSFTQEGITATGLYEPKLKQGGPLRIESIVPKASGLWKITSLKHRLAANYPGAEAWESEVSAAYPKGK